VGKYRHLHEFITLYNGPSLLTTFMHHLVQRPDGSAFPHHDSELYLEGSTKSGGFALVVIF
jgi:hypothetical protein